MLVYDLSTGEFTLRMLYLIFLDMLLCRILWSCVARGGILYEFDVVVGSLCIGYNLFVGSGCNPFVDSSSGPYSYCIYIALVE